MDGLIPSTDPQRVNVSGIRHTYRTLDDEERALVDILKDRGQAFWDSVDQCTISHGDRPGSARSYALAKTKIEEAVMWAVHGLTNPAPSTLGDTEGGA